jgi:hypothetical protein
MALLEQQGGVVGGEGQRAGNGDLGARDIAASDRDDGSELP